MSVFVGRYGGGGGGGNQIETDDIISGITASKSGSNWTISFTYKKTISELLFLAIIIDNVDGYGSWGRITICRNGDELEGYIVYANNGIYCNSVSANASGVSVTFGNGRMNLSGQVTKVTHGLFVMYYA